MVVQDATGIKFISPLTDTNFWYSLSRECISSLDITCEIQLIKRITKKAILQRFRQNLNSK